MKTRNILMYVTGALYVLLYLHAAFSKLMDLSSFELAMKKQPLDDSLAPYLAYGIPTAEIALSFLIILHRDIRLGVLLSTAVMAIFTIYIILIKVNYYGMIPCGCGGLITNISWTGHLILNCSFLLLSIISFMLYKKPDRNDPTLRPLPNPV